MSDQKDAADKKIAKSSLIVGYNLVVGIVRLAFLAAVSLLPPLQIGSYDTKNFYTGTEEYSTLPIKILIPADSPAFIVMEDISFLLSDSFLGWVLVAHFAFQIVAARLFDEGLRKKEDTYFIPMYIHFILELVFLVVCGYFGAKFAHNIFFPHFPETWYGIIGHCLCGLLILIIAFAAALAHFSILIKQLIEETTLIKKKPEQSVNSENND